MPKVGFVCEHCGKDFAVWPAQIRYVESRGMRVRFCSRQCTGAAKASGACKSRPRTGHVVPCVICGKQHYRKLKLMRAKQLFCSEPCRIEGIHRGIVDKNRPFPERKNGMEITCKFCSKVVYRKKSMISRRIAMTCGNRRCVSAYGRSLWGLPPFTAEQAKKPKGTSRRTTNFTPTQRIAWLGKKCAWCDSVDNLCLDHIIPVAAGGTSTRNNAQTLCQPCNIWKGNHVDRPLALAYKSNLQSGG